MDEFAACDVLPWAAPLKAPEAFDASLVLDDELLPPPVNPYWLTAVGLVVEEVLPVLLLVAPLKFPERLPLPCAALWFAAELPD